MEKNKSNKRNKTKNDNSNKKSTWKKVVLILLLIILIAGSVFAYKVHKNGGGLTGILATAVGHDENTKKNLGEFQCLILGISTDEAGSLLTDTIMIASYNPNTQKAALISVPRDSYTGKNPAKATAYEKINALYSRKQDPQTVLKAVNELTGLDLKYYVIVKTEAFIKLVNAIGEVTFNVPINMNYDDTSQNLHIHLKAGEQKLDGDKAEQLVRFRHNNDGTSYPSEYGDNDLGRMRTQREFMMAVIKQTAKPGNIFKLGEILKVAEENVITNVDFDAAKDYIPYAVEFNTDNLETGALPGTVPSIKQTNNVSIFVVDKVGAQELVEKMFYGLEDNGEENTETTNTSVSSTSNQVSTNKNTVNNSSSNSSSSTTAKTKSSLKVEVLNGSGVSQNLQKVVDQLKSNGFNVTRTGSTNNTAKTVIMNKKEISTSLLDSIKSSIGVGTIQSSTSSSSKSDVVIIIGKDYN